jgi:hypothetical protein
MDKERKLKEYLELECQKLNSKIKQLTTNHEEILKIKEQQQNIQKKEMKNCLTNLNKKQMTI